MAVSDLEHMGYNRIVGRSDGEPALVQVQEALADHRGHATILENPPAHDPQSNGEAERAVVWAKASSRRATTAIVEFVSEGVSKAKKVLVKGQGGATARPARLHHFGDDPPYAANVTAKQCH